MSIDFIKALTTSALSAVSLNFGELGDLLWLFVAAAVLDYIMGVSAAIYNKELSSSIGFKGILKKVGTFAAIAVSFISDQVALEGAISMGAQFYTGGAITTTVIIWFIINELISVLENLAKMDVALPAFLTAAIRLLKCKTDNEDEDEDDKDYEGEDDNDNANKDE